MHGNGGRKFVPLAVAGLLIVFAGCTRKAKNTPESESGKKSAADAQERWFGGGKTNACNYLTQQDAEDYFGAGAKLIWYPYLNECYLVDAQTSKSDLHSLGYPAGHPVIILSSYAREQWDKDKDPNPSLDRAIDGLGDEALDDGSAIFFRKGDGCFKISGFSHSEHTLNELAERVISRIQ